MRCFQEAPRPPCPLTHGHGEIVDRSGQCVTKIEFLPDGADCTPGAELSGWYVVEYDPSGEPYDAIGPYMSADEARRYAVLGAHI